MAQADLPAASLSCGRSGPRATPRLRPPASLPARPAVSCLHAALTNATAPLVLRTAKCRTINSNSAIVNHFPHTSGLVKHKTTPQGFGLRSVSLRESPDAPPPVRKPHPRAPRGGVGRSKRAKPKFLAETRGVWRVFLSPVAGPVQGLQGEFFFYFLLMSARVWFISAPPSRN